MDPLLAWLDAPRADAGIHVLRDRGWACHTYEELAQRVRGVFERLSREGVRPGDLVAIGTGECIEFAAAFYGALRCGATAVPIPPPTDASVSPARHVAALLEAAGAGRVVGDCGGVPAVASVGRLGGAASPSSLAMVQFTSGSTGRPRPVHVTWANLAAHVAMSRRWLDWGPGDGAASWLPLHHDMGLVGLLVNSVCGQSDLWQLTPEQFLERPTRWLECFSAHGATITAAPTFGYGYLTRRADGGEMRGMDLSAWRCAVVGAERLAPATLGAFTDLVGRRGFAADALVPAYGLAEATLAVTGKPLQTPTAAVALDWPAMRGGAPVPITGRATLSRANPAGLLVSCGQPLPAVEVSIVNDAGEAVPEGWLGEITVSGPTVTTHPDAALPEALTTGDAGFLLEGELYVVGRMADSFKVRGRRVYAETLEAKLADALRLPAARCVVIPTVAADRDGITVVLETSRAVSVPTVHRIVRSEVGSSLRVRVEVGERGVILRTTSGKPRRREMWRQRMSQAIEVAA